ESRFPWDAGAADKPLLTMGDVRRMQEQVRSLKARREELLNSVKQTEQNIETLEKKLALIAEMFIPDSTSEPEPEPEPKVEPIAAPTEVLSEPPIPKTTKPRSKRGDDSTADAYMRRLATRVAAERPDGFAAVELMDLWLTDPSIPEQHHKVHRTYFY